MRHKKHVHMGCLVIMIGAMSKQKSHSQSRMIQRLQNSRDGPFHSSPYFSMNDHRQIFTKSKRLLFTRRVQSAYVEWSQMWVLRPSACLLLSAVQVLLPLPLASLFNISKDRQEPPGLQQHPNVRLSQLVDWSINL